MKAVLNAYELWDMVTNVDVKPVSYVDPNDPWKKIMPDASDLQAWSIRDADALCAIVTSCNDNVLTLTQHVQTFAEAWSILKS